MTTSNDVQLMTMIRISRRTVLALLLLPLLSCTGDSEMTAILGNDATLRSLSVSSGSLNPSFNKETTSYAVGVSNTTASVTVSANPTDNGARITINGAARGNPASSVINLAIGSNTVSIVVTAENGATIKTYTLVVTRAAPIGA